LKFKTERNKDDDFLIDEIVVKSEPVITPLYKEDTAGEEAEKVLENSVKENNADFKIS
jgi:hypothetical protein